MPPVTTARGGPLIKPWRRRSSEGSTVLPIPSAPSTPASPNPANGGTILRSLLSWSAPGATTVDLYFGTSATPPLLAAYYVGSSYVPTLTPGTTYFWQIVARNAGGTTGGPIWSFSVPSASAMLFLLDGALSTARIRFPGGLSIRDVLGAQPNTGNVLFDTSPPTAGQAITIGLGSLDPDRLLFGGEIQFLDESYELRKDLEVWPCNLVDHTFAINKRRPFGTWVNTSVTTIAQYCVAVFAPGFTANHVQAGLPAISINFDGTDDFMSCMSRLASSINGRTKVDYLRDLHLFITEAVDAPDPIDNDHPVLNDPPMRFSTDLSQCRTRVYGKGHGEALLSDVLASEWILPVADSVMFNDQGGQVVLGTTADGAQTQILSYAGIHRGSGGGLVGPGAQPSSAPFVTLANGTGIETGLHDYAITFVTASGESLPSPRKTIDVGHEAPDLVGPHGIGTLENDDGSRVPSPLSNPISGHTYRMVYTWTRLSDGVETLPSPASNGVVSNGHALMIAEGGLEHGFSGPSGFSAPNFYFSDNGGPFQKFSGFSAVGSYAVFTWSSLGASPPAVNQTKLTGIPIGGVSVTARKVYRTAIGSSQLKLLATIADNTTTTFGPDSTADASLGANVPTIDTSGLSQPGGQVLAGESTLIVAGTAPFSPGGGWAIIGNGQQVIRYTGITGTALTGIPTSGPGSIVASVSFNSTVTAAPALVGMNAYNGIPVALAKGASVNIWVQRDDLAAQAALGALERDPNGNATDGIREYTITDERSTEARMVELCDADLARFARPIVGVKYHCRDPKTRAGKTVAINLAASDGFFDPAFFDPDFFDTGGPWGLTGEFLIQDVTITFDEAPSLLPRYAATASSAKFSFEDLLQRVLVTT